ncbi:MAG TPA: RNA polymerase sigma factor [bacterium]|nr:RNA polymerase sigma factor [bacterium]HPN44561.1 RNA polymerase sigma factor [bacterium]
MDNHEIQLVQQAQQGNLKAFEKLVIRYDRSIVQIANLMMGNRADAQDVYQETFLRAFQNISGFRFQSHFKTWLTRIAINTAINMRRKRRIGQFISIFDLADENSDICVIPVKDVSMTADMEQASAELRQQIEKGLQKLSSKERAVFTLKQYQDYKIKDIAVILNCAEGTVKNYLFRATQKLKKHLVPYYNI